MNFKKTVASVLAVAMMFGTVSAVSFAEDSDLIREESIYGIDLEKATVDGEEKIAVMISDIPKEAITHEWEYEIKNEEKNWVEKRRLDYLAVVVEVGDQLLNFFLINKDDKNKENKCVITKDRNSMTDTPYALWGTYLASVDSNLESFGYSVEEEDNTISLTIYIDTDDDLAELFSEMDSAFVYTFAQFWESGSRIVSGDNNGASNGGGWRYIFVSSDGTIIDDPVFNEDGELIGNEGKSVKFKERVKIANNLNKPDNIIITNLPDIPGLQAQISGADNKQMNPAINENGTIELSDLANGEYTFTFSATNYAPRDYVVTVKDGTVTGLENGVELHHYGDIDGNGKISMAEVGKANAHVKKTATLEGYDLSVCDLNGDGKISMQEVGQMNSHAKRIREMW